MINFAAGKSSHTELVLRKGFSAFSVLLESNNEFVVNDLMLVLSNIAGDSEDLRNTLLREGIFKKVLRVTDNVEDGSDLEKSCSWFLSNLCRHRASGANALELKSCIYVLARYFRCPHPNVLKNVWWALKYLTDGSYQFVLELLNLGICQPLIELLS